MKNLNQQLPDLLPIVSDDPRDYQRRIYTVRALNQFAVETIRSEYGDTVAESYDDELWGYRELGRFAVDIAGHPQGTTPQVFSRWYDLTSHKLDLLPISFESAKKTTYDLSLLGAAVVSQVINTPVSKQLLGDYHAYRLEQLTLPSIST